MALFFDCDISGKHTSFLLHLFMVFMNLYGCFFCRKCFPVRCKIQTQMFFIQTYFMYKLYLWKFTFSPLCIFRIDTFPWVFPWIPWFLGFILFHGFLLLFRFFLIMHKYYPCISGLRPFRFFPNVFVAGKNKILKKT